jgi:hypothetical protein
MHKRCLLVIATGYYAGSAEIQVLSIYVLSKTTDTLPQPTLPAYHYISRHGNCTADDRAPLTADRSAPLSTLES